jgi:hypothetical protein
MPVGSLYMYTTGKYPQQEVAGLAAALVDGVAREKAFYIAAVRQILRHECTATRRPWSRLSKGESLPSMRRSQPIICTRACRVRTECVRPRCAVYNAFPVV